MPVSGGAKNEVILLGQPLGAWRGSNPQHLHPQWSTLPLSYRHHVGGYSNIALYVSQALILRVSHCSRKPVFVVGNNVCKDTDGFQCVKVTCLLLLLLRRISDFNGSLNVCLVSEAVPKVRNLRNRPYKWAQWPLIIGATPFLWLKISVRGGVK